MMIIIIISSIVVVLVVIRVVSMVILFVFYGCRLHLNSLKDMFTLNGFEPNQTVHTEALASKARQGNQ